MPDEMTMVERVARAIYHRIDAHFERYGSGQIEAVADLVDVTIEGRVDLLEVARAAIEEMRNPTGGMEDWFRDNLEHTETGAWIWKGAIDAALKEQD